MKMISRISICATSSKVFLTGQLHLPLVTARNWYVTLLFLGLLAPFKYSVEVAADVGNTLPTATNSLELAPQTAALAAPGAATSILEQFSPNCSAVRHIFVAKGIEAVDIPIKPNSEMVLRYCESPSVGTCCTYSMETKMALQARLLLEKQFKDHISKLATMLGSKAQKFNDVFRDMLLQSKKEFHNMFMRTYGVIYQQNSYVFSDMFNELENYYSRGRVDLIEVMDKFFNTLYQKMFQVLNAQYSFDEKYLRCVSEHMKELKPFGDVPDKLSVQLKRSFVATRTYGHALTTAADITKKLVNIRLNADCTAALAKMLHCGTCKGYAEKPCFNYCINVMKGCLYFFSELENEWQNYSSAMDKVAERLLGSFNIVMVVEPINIKISEAIMNFQDAGRDITNRVFQGCGRPTLGRPKRAINTRWFNPAFKSDTKRVIKRSILPEVIATFDDDILDIDATLDDAIVLREKRVADPGSVTQSAESLGETANTSGGGRRNKKKQQKQQRKNEESDYSGRDPILDKLVRDIRQRVKESKFFWANLPNMLCNTEESSALSTDSDTTCWNGHTIDRYMHSVATEYGRNPEFPGNPTSTRQTALVTTQLYYLKKSSEHLRNAYNGQDVEWSEEDEGYQGSGSGGGGGVDDESGDDDDDEDGSGLSSNSFDPNEKPGLKHDDNPAVRVNAGDDEDEESNNILTHTSTDHAQDTNELEEDADNVVDDEKNNSAKSKHASMTLRKALLVYLLPMYMTWFGGICADLL